MIQQWLAKSNKLVSFLIIFIVSVSFVYYTAEPNVFDREENMFEILKTEPFAPSSIIDEKINAYFGDEKSELRKQFEMLKHKQMHNQYYKFGEMDEKIKGNDVDHRHATVFLTYLCFVLVALVFLGDELAYSKRI